MGRQLKKLVNFMEKNMHSHGSAGTHQDPGRAGGAGVTSSRSLSVLSWECWAYLHVQCEVIHGSARPLWVSQSRGRPPASRDSWDTCYPWVCLTHKTCERYTEFS
ncbi:unnamed protein product [Arctogadus glacialis]